MKTFHIRSFPVLILAATVLLAMPVLAGYEENITFSSGTLEVYNLIGEITVQGSGGSSFEVRVQVQGSDADKDDIEIKQQDGGTAKLSVTFPAERSFVYPRLGRNSKTTFSVNQGSDNWLSEVFGQIFSHDKITVRGSGSGFEAWADITIMVPDGATLNVKNGVGEIKAENVDGSIVLDSSSGQITANKISGDLLADTGSGHVSVSYFNGDKLSIDTGSGHVELKECEANSIDVDTGSGHVDIEEARSDSLRVDTGSGRVSALHVKADSADIDTGSGGVTLELDEMGTGRFRIDTGSGGIKLVIPRGAGAEIEAGTGSGGINLELDAEIQIKRRSQDYLACTIGDGSTHFELDTGSGGITISDR
jgi:hypothetical protein